MKRNLLLTGILALALCLPMVSCDDDNDDKGFPSNDYSELLLRMYPAARSVEWEARGQYTVAEFYNEASQEMDVWFNNKVQWVLTETDMGEGAAAVPVECRAALEASEYAAWRVEDVDMYQRPSTPFTRVEVEQGETENAIIFNEEGEIVTVLPGNPDITPDTVVNN